MVRNVRSEIYAFWRRVVVPGGIAGVRVSWVEGETIVEIDDVVPRLPFTKREAGFAVTTKSNLLRTTHFPATTPRTGIHHNAGKDRGRTVYLSHRPPRRGRRDEPYRGQVLAALSFHIDPAADAPLLVTNLAIRGDTHHRDLSRAAAGWMMFYLLEVARLDSRPLEVGVEISTQPNSDDFEAIGFRPASTPPAYGSPYLAFRAPYKRRDAP